MPRFPRCGPNSGRPFILDGRPTADRFTGRQKLGKEPPSSSNRQQPAPSSEQFSVHRLQGRTHHLSAQGANLVAEHDDLDCASSSWLPRKRWTHLVKRTNSM